MKVASLSCDVLLCTHFSQARNHQGTVTQTDHLSTERVLAVWNCLCRRGYSYLCFRSFFYVFQLRSCGSLA